MKINKKKAFLTLSIIILMIGIGIGVWRFHLSPVWYFDADGSSIWKHQMIFIKKTSFWPTTTHYGVHWNGISISINDHQIKKDRWIQFVLWNGQGIKTVNVRETTTGTFLYPTEKDVRTLHGFSQFETLNNRYLIIGIDPPASETKLLITVTDIKGNVTGDVVEINKIK